MQFNGPNLDLDLCVLSYKPTIGRGVSKKCVLETFQFEQQIGISGYFSWKVHELSDFLS